MPVSAFLHGEGPVEDDAILEAADATLTCSETLGKLEKGTWYFRTLDAS